MRFFGYYFVNIRLSKLPPVFKVASVQFFGTSVMSSHINLKAEKMNEDEAHKSPPDYPRSNLPPRSCNHVPEVVSVPFAGTSVSYLINLRGEMMKGDATQEPPIGTNWVQFAPLFT